MDYKSMKINDIIIWCQANNQVEWLKAEAAKQVPCKVYPKVEKDGKKVVDKSAKPNIELRPITFIQLKNNFVAKFMPELMPKKEKKATMYDLIKAL